MGREELARIKSIQEHMSRAYENVAPNWGSYVKNLQGWDRKVMLRLLENEARHLAELQLNETTTTGSIGTIEKFIFPMIRAVWPTLVSHDLVSVQPMDGPTSLVFMLDFLAGSTKGSTNKGDALITARSGMREEGQLYTSETVANEPIPDAGGTLAYLPIRPGTVSVTWAGAGTPPAVDDSNGVISGGGTTGTIDYSTGAVTLTLVGGATSGSATITYDYNSELSDLVPQLDMSLTSTHVVARADKIRARWSAEAAANLRSVHGLDAEIELVKALAQLVRFSIDNKIINNLWRGASAGTGSFDADPPTGTTYFNHQMTLIKELSVTSNLIFKGTRRGYGNWIVAGVDAASLIEAHPLFESSGALNGPGVVFSGVLANRWKVFKTPFATNQFNSGFKSTSALIGYKGTDWYDAGFLYCPYIPFFQTPTVMLDDMMFRKGVMTSYAQKAVNMLFYARFEFLNV